MRILIVTPLYPPDLGNLAVYVKALVIRLHTHHTVTVATYGDLPETVPGVDVVCTPKRWPTPLRLMVFTIRLWQATRAADLLYVSDGASVGFPSVIVSRLRRLPLVRFVMEDESWERTVHAKKIESMEQDSSLTRTSTQKITWIRRLQGWVLAHTDQVFVPSPLHQATFQALSHISGTILPYPLNPSLALPFVTEPVPEQLLFTSTITKHSGIEETLLALCRLRNTFQNIRLIIANTGPDQDFFKQRVQVLNLEPNVQFLGRVSQAEKQDLLCSSAISLCLQTSGACIREIYEAYTHNIPVITTTDLASPYVVIPHKTGLIIPPQNSETLIQAITALLQDERLRASLIKGGQEILRTQTDWDIHLKTLFLSWEKLVGKHIAHV
jgi:glycosyltransferase involved in cell wall biosynthesis